MNHGIVDEIYIAPQKGAPNKFVEQIHVVPGAGIEGDHYFYEPGINKTQPEPGFQLTLIELEAIEAICKEDGIPITPNQTRRNLVTHGVSLNNLVGLVFSIGDIQVRGIRLCEPCNKLAIRIDPRIEQSMAHRGGLRVDILTDGIIHRNDTITIPD
jgi:MOSC domain-containing protein YiiM